MSLNALRLRGLVAAAALSAGLVITVPAVAAAAPEVPSPSGSWSATGDMDTGGSNGNLIPLADGTALMLWNDADAEIYDPGTGTWSQTSSPSTTRFMRAQVPLDDGTVLLAGGRVDSPNGETTSSTEIYDPATGTSTPTDSMSSPRAGLIWVKLDDGRVLVAGGDDGTGPSVTYPVSQAELDALNAARLTTAEIYDPDTGTWSDAGDTGMSRNQGSLVQLDDGRVLVAGGASVGKGSTTIQPLGDVHHDDARLFDPSTGEWTATGSLNEARSGRSGFLLPDGTVIVTSPMNTQSEAEVYDPATGTWELVARPTPKILLDGPSGTIAVSSPPVAPLFQPLGDALVGFHFKIAPLADGSVLAAGGQHYFDPYLSPRPMESAAIFN